MFITKFCRVLIFILEILHKGSSLPGLIAFRYNKKILKILSDKYKVILVTGTNGKTTTASLIAKILSDNGNSVITNASGANMISGIITLFIKHEKNRLKEFAVIEIDEANVPIYSETANAEYIVCTNIFKDQLDRYGEIYTAIDKIKKGAKSLHGVKLILAGDEPLFNFINGDKVYFGFDTFPDRTNEDKSNIEGLFCPKCNNKYIYDFYVYNHLGKYRCDFCGYSRPVLNYSVNRIIHMKDNYLEFEVNNGVVLKANMGGLYSIYNIMAAYALLKEIGVKETIIVRSISEYKPQFGRHETIKFNDKELRLILVKNPAGFNESLKLTQLNHKKINYCFMLNDNFADGRDVSWIWDVDFESNMKDHEEIYISGSRCNDMAIRLAIAGCDKNKLIIEKNLHVLFEKLINCEEDNCIYIYATYTAMVEFRKIMAKEKIVKHSW